MGRKNEVELATLRAKLTQKGQIPSATEGECTQLRSRVTSLEIFAILGQTRDQKRAMIEASHVKASNKADDLAIRLLQAWSYIHSTLSLEYGSYSWHFIVSRLRQLRRRRHWELLLLRLAHCRFFLIQRGRVTPQVPVQGGSWFVFDIHMADIVGLLEIWALMPQGCFVPNPQMI